MKKRLPVHAVAFVVAQLVAGILPAAAQTTIGTTGQWNGIDAIDSFGETGTATFGQTFVAPSGVGPLKSFAFYVDDYLDPDFVDFQAFIMAWDGAKASGPVLFQSGPLSTTNNGGADGFERINVIITHGLQLIPGASYVAFFSATNLFDGQDGHSRWGTTGSDTYSGGGFVFLDNTNDFSALTSNSWDTLFFNSDLVFEFVFDAPASGTAPAAAPQTLLLVDVAAIASALFSSVPTALAQRELALGGSRTALRDFNGRLFRQRASVTGTQPGEDHSGDDADDETEYHTVTMGEGDGEEPANSSKGTRIVYGTRKPQAHRWEVYSSFDYGNLDIDADRNFLGLQSDTYAESVGVEYALTRHLVLGAGVSYLQSNADWGPDIDGITFAAYASAGWGGLYADLLYGATLLEHDIDRDTGLGATAHAKPDSVTHAVNFNTGYNFRFGRWSTGPFAGVDYARAEIDGYTERGGGTAATRVSDQTTDSLLSRVGWQVSRRMERTWGSITPQVRIGWERENLDSDDDLTVGLLHSPYYLVRGNTIRSTGAGFEVTVPGQGRESDFMTAGGGVLLEFGRRLNVLLDYEGNFFGDGYAAHFAKFSLGWKF